jgi:hypothetical protein
MTFVRGLLTAAVLGAGVTLGLSGRSLAAGAVVVTVSPAEVRVGEPVEILVRTFVPFREEALGLRKPLEPFPVPSGIWDVLYSWDDYPFDVDVSYATVGPATVRAILSRDPRDATLWRGSVSLPEAGTWIVRVRNFPNDTPGASAEIRVTPAAEPRLFDPSEPSMAALGLALGVLAGVFVGRRTSRSAGT